MRRFVHPAGSWRRAASRLALSGAVVLVVVLGVLLGRPVFRGLVIVGTLSVLLAYLVAPLAERLRRRLRVARLSRSAALALSVLFIYAAVGATGVATWTGLEPRVERQVTALAEGLPGRLELLRGRLHGVEGWVNRLAHPESFRRHAVALTRTGVASLESHASSVAAEVLDSRGLLPWLWFVPVIAFLLITRWDAFRKTTVSALPEGHLRWRGDEFFAHVNFVLAGYVRAQVWSAAIVGLLATAGFALIGVPYALVVGLLAGTFEFFPVVGPLAAAVLAAALVEGERVLVLIAFLIGLRLVQDYLVYPRLIGRRMHLHALAVIAAIWGGAVVGGAAGVLVAVPVVGVAAVALRHYRDYRAIESLVREHERKQQTKSA